MYLCFDKFQLINNTTKKFTKKVYYLYSLFILSYIHNVTNKKSKLQ